MKIFQDILTIIKGRDNYEIKASCSSPDYGSDILSKNPFISKRLSFIYNADKSGMFAYKLIEMKDAWKDSKYLKISDNMEIVVEEYTRGTKFPIIDIVVNDEKRIIYLVYEPAKQALFKSNRHLVKLKKK